MYMVFFFWLKNIFDKLSILLIVKYVGRYIGKLKIVFNKI